MPPHQSDAVVAGVITPLDSSGVNTPSGESKPLIKKETKVTYLSLYRFAARQDKVYLVLALFAAMVHGAAMPAFSFIFGNLLNSLSGGPSMAEIEKLSLYLLILAGITMIASAAWNSIFTATATAQATRCRVMCMSRLLGKDTAWFDEHPPAELPSRLQENVTKIQTAIGYKAGLFVMNISMFLAGYVIACIRGWQLFLVVLAIVPVIAIASAVMGKSLAKHSKLAQAFYAKAGAVAEEALNAIRTVTSFNGHTFELKRYSAACDAAKEGGIRGTRVSGIAIGFVMGAIFIGYSLCFYFGGYFIKKGVTNSWTDSMYTGGDVMTILFSVIMGTFALGQAAPSVQAFAEGIAAGADLFALVEGKASDSEIEGSSGNSATTPLLTKVKTIDIDSVSFTYPSRPEVQVLNAVSLSISEGQKVALVGESGSGKSSLIALLERFYDPSNGSIKINGVDIASLPVEGLRSLFGYVGQEPVLFATSIANNLRYGLADPASVTDRDMRSACRRANVLEFIDSLPEGFDTYVGPGGGSQISGGQKQRIAIARALLRNPQILLLDEATSALDNESEKQVQETIDKLSAESSLMTISIAHRLSTVRNADKIFVFQRGLLVEEGRHDDLMVKNGLYSVLVSTQAAAAAATVPVAAPTAAVVRTRNSGHSSLDSDFELVRQLSSTTGMEAAAGTMYTADQAERMRVKQIGKSYKVPWRRVIGLNEAVKKWYIPALIGSACSGITLPLNSYLVSQSLGAFQLQAVSIDAMMTELSHYALGYVGLAVGAGLAMFMQWSSFGVLGESFTKTVRVLLFEKLLSMDISFFDKPENAPGKLCDTLSSNATKMSSLSGQAIGSFVQIFASLFAGIVIAFCGSVKLAAVMTATLPLLILAAAVHTSVMVGMQQSSSFEMALKESALIASEALQNMRTLRAFTARKWTLNRYSECVMSPLTSATKEAVISGVIYGVSNSIIFLCYSLGFWYGGRLVVYENVPMPTMLQSLMGIVLAAQGAGQSMAFLPEMVAAKAAAFEVFGLLDSSTRSSAKNGTTLLDKPNKIEFRNVKFSYPTRLEVQVLKGLSFTVRAGEKIALVGPSGSGKSSVMALLERFYDPSEGEIFVNDTPLSALNVHHWRDQIGYVGQEPVLFDLTLEENLRYGNDAASHENVESAARRANMDFVGRVQWTDRLGPKGSLLSGGQKQRTAIARALLRDPPILLLDEATSALDAASEAVVQLALDAAQEGRTTFTIAHRLSTIQNYDKILVIANGVMVESGSHAELMEKGGVYRDLYVKGQQVTPNK